MFGNIFEFFRNR